MFYSSRNSRKHVYHYAGCRYLKLTKNDNRVSFNTVDEAKAQGFCPCAYCNPISRQYLKDRKAILAFCENYQFKHFFCFGDLYVISAKDTAWRISTSGDNGKGKQLLHESKANISYDRRKMPYIDREYHVQKTPTTSLMGYLVYIQNHDLYEKARTEKRKVEQALRVEEAKSIRAIQKQISRQNRKHKKRGHLESSGQKRRRANQQLRALASSFSDYRSAQYAYI